MNKTIRDAIQENIVEDIDRYRSIYKDFVNLIQTINKDYESKMSFDEFYIKVLNNIEGIDESFENLTKKDYIDKLYDSLTIVSKEELKSNPKHLEIFDKIINKDKEWMKLNQDN